MLCRLVTYTMALSLAEFSKLLIAAVEKVVASANALSHKFEEAKAQLT